MMDKKVNPGRSDHRDILVHLDQLEKQEEQEQKEMKDQEEILDLMVLKVDREFKA